MAELTPVIETNEHRWMRAWIAGDTRTMRALTSRNFRLVIGAKPPVLLDAKSWLEGASTRYRCKSYRFGDIYNRQLGSVAVFATQLEIEASFDSENWSGLVWITDLWRKGTVLRGWRLTDRLVSRLEDADRSQAIRSLQLWR